MTDRCAGGSIGFEWRAQTGRWRWLILGAIGVAPIGCGGRSGNTETDGLEGNLQGNAASAGSASVPESGTAGAGGSGVVRDGGVSAAGTGAGGARPTAVPSACEGPLTDLGGGWERCGNGMVHRRELGSCSSSLPRASAATAPYSDPASLDAGYFGECRFDSDCTANPYGHCEWSPYAQGTYCEYGCVTNADCPSNQACVCGDPVGTCRPASCATDAECGAGLLCSDFVVDPGCGGQAFACQKAADECAAASDCPEDQYCVRGNYGTGLPDAPSYCSPSQCIIGRPFLVAGDERLASVTTRSDWYRADAAGKPAPSLSPALRDAVHRGWLEQALMEHASVAAFARFSLHLLALGAPAHLCQQAASAMQDEIEHARACFDLARRHSDHDVGPGPLDMTGALDTTDLQSIVLGTIAEGCIGETVAAIEAAEALAHCNDEATRSTLTRIAHDETRHAELAWQFVAWALDVGPATLRDQVRAAFAAATRANTAPPTPSRLDLQLAQHGLIAPSLRADLRARVLRDVIEPCTRALLDPPSTPSQQHAPTAELSA